MMSGDNKGKKKSGMRAGRVATVQDTVLTKTTAGRVPVEELVKGLRAEGYSRDEAVTALIGLRRDKKLAIDEAAPYSGLASYALSPPSLWFWATLGAILASLALIISVPSGAVLYLRYAFGAALILFIPGYALTEALYPKGELDGLLRLGLSVGLSLALVPLTGLVLNYTPFGIRLLPVVLSVSGLATVLLAFALVRKHTYYKLAKGVN
jgi:hypothetical protein